MPRLQPISKGKHVALILLWLGLSCFSFTTGVGGAGWWLLLAALVQGFLLYTKIHGDYTRQQQGRIERESAKPAIPQRRSSTAFYHPGDDDS